MKLWQRIRARLYAPSLPNYPVLPPPPPLPDTAVTDTIQEQMPDRLARLERYEQLLSAAQRRRSREDPIV